MTKRRDFREPLPCDICGEPTRSNLRVCQKTRDCKLEYNRRDYPGRNGGTTWADEQEAARVSQHAVEQAKASLRRRQAAERARNGLAPAATEATRLARIEAQQARIADQLARIEAALERRTA